MAEREQLLGAVGGLVDIANLTLTRWNEVDDSGREFLAAALTDGCQHVLKRLENYAPEPSRWPHVLNTCTGEWVRVAAEDLDECLADPDGFAERAQERFRVEWDARERKDENDA